MAKYDDNNNNDDNTNNNISIIITKIIYDIWKAWKSVCN